MADKDLVLFAMGDVIMNRDDYAQRWAPLMPILSQADIRYCQAEQVLSDRGTPSDPSVLPWRMPAKYAAAYKYAGMDVASTNGNHAMEWGTEGLMDTIDILRKNGVQTFGAGKDIDDARKPAIIEKKGTKIAFLGYNSIIAFGDEADVNWPGVAPMRVDTFYQEIEHNQPAGPARVRSFADREDIANMKEDVKKARQSADIVAVALHYGIHYVRAEMAEYQFEVAHAAIDSGADIILGHHPHLLKAIEVYKGKVIFHSLGNFLCDGLKQVPGFSSSRKIANLREANTYHKPDPEYPLLGPRPGDLVNTGIGRIVIRDKKIQRVSFIPMLADPKKDFEIRPLEAGSPEFNKIVNYIKDITKVGGVKTEFKVEGGEVVIVL